jgi:hypothetical protein
MAPEYFALSNGINTLLQERIRMRLEPLYRIRFSYPDDLSVNLVGKKGTEEAHFAFAEGTCEGRVSGKFRGSNHPRRRTDETFAMSIQGYIETHDGALIMLDYRGYGRSTDRSQELYKAYSAANEKTKYRRQVVGFARHVTDSEQYRWLNDAVCGISGEVRAPVGIPREQVKQPDVTLVFDVAELVWESPQE